MKTTKADFNKFKRAFLYWAEKLGCQGYEFFFFHEPIKDAFASITINEAGRVATIEYSSVLTKNDYAVKKSPEDSGKHEAIHLCTHRLYWLGEQRFVGSCELEHEWEKIVRVLEKVIK